MNRISRNPLTLRFASEELEQKFLENYHQRCLVRFRWAVALGIFLYSIFAILDSVTVGPLWPRIWLIRFAVVNPVLVLTFIFSYSRHFIRYYQLVCSIVILVAGAGILAMLAVIPAPAQYLYSQGLTLVIIYNFTFLGLRFVYSSLNGLLLIIAFEIVSAVVNPLPYFAFINNNFFLISATVIGMAVAYYLERLNRDNFIHGVSMKKLAEADSLTGLMNRGFFIEEVKSILGQPGRIETLSAFCILDLDGFKAINDNLGHLVGDEILVNLGQSIKSKMRSVDLIGRLGGDEFGFFFPEIRTQDDLLNIFAKLKNEFQNMSKGICYLVTFSVGCVIFGPELRNFFDCYAKADRALLQAKKEKNNLVIVDSQEKPLLQKSLDKL
jgi:diguanylate cyclase (GGDEF)-like protein